MKIIVIVLLIVVMVLLGISYILGDFQRRNFKYCFSSKSQGVFKYINTSSDTFKKIKKYNSYRNTLHFICIICIFAILSIVVFT